jgi:hypothetical protein
MSRSIIGQLYILEAVKPKIRSQVEKNVMLKEFLKVSATKSLYHAFVQDINGFLDSFEKCIDKVAAAFQDFKCLSWMFLDHFFSTRKIEESLHFFQKHNINIDTTKLTEQKISLMKFHRTKFQFAVDIRGGHAQKACEPTVRSDLNTPDPSDIIRSFMMTSVNLNEMPSTKLYAMLVAEKKLLQNFRNK